MKAIQKSRFYTSCPETVFDHLDDLGITGMHMTKSSMMMMGSRLNFEYLSQNRKGPGTKYRWTGRMLGLTMDFTVEVTKWDRGKEKTWETIGPAKMIIYSWFRMHLAVAPCGKKTLAELSITYERPKELINRILSFFFADLYCRWCLKNMLNDSNRALGKSV